MKKRIFSFVLCLCMIFALVALSASATTDEVVYSATIMEAYGGAKGVVSMTFDDGDWATNSWLNGKFDEYDLYGTTAAIVRKNFEKATTDAEGNTVYVEDTDKTAKWKELFANGRLEPESHSYTHLVLPSDWWAERNAASQPNSLDNNTEENYQKEIVDSKNLIKKYFDHDVICYVPSNNTLSDGAMAVVMDNYYAVRQGKRTGGVCLQNLDPVVGSCEAGGWYNLWMTSFGFNEHYGIQTVIPESLKVMAEEGGWLVTLCHGINDTTGDATYAEAEAAFALMSQYQKEGKIWVTTFGRATKYIRERQNSTVSYSYTSDKVSVEVMMAEMTEDGLPLSADIFNHPLTVRIELPGGVEKVTYPLNGATCSANTFVEDGKTYAYVNVVPNSGEVEITRVSQNGIFSASDLEEALSQDGEYKIAGNIVLDNTQNLTVSASNITLDLCGNTITFKGKNTFTVPAGTTLTLKNGEVVIAHNYKTTAKKGMSEYIPVVNNEDGTYSLGTSTSIADAGIITGDDIYQTHASAAFTVKGGALMLDEISLERSVCVSNNGELLYIESGSVTMQNSKLFESVGTEAWANTNTRLIYMQRNATPTKLTVLNSSIEQAYPNSYYNGSLLCADGPVSIDSATGAVTKEKYTIDSGDKLKICYIAGTDADTGVEILFENSYIHARQGGFSSATNYESIDTFTMRDSRFILEAKANYKELGFELYSAEMLFENSYLSMQDNIFWFNAYADRASGLGTTSLTMKQCMVYGSHPFRYISGNNEIYLEDTYVQNGMIQWQGYDTADAQNLPTVQIAGSFYTSATISDSVPVYDKTGTVWNSGTSKNWWFNLVKTNESDIIKSGVPSWYFTVKHTDGSADVVDVTSSTEVQLAEGDIIFLRADCATPVTFLTNANVSIRSYGYKFYPVIKGEGSITVEDGTLGGVSIIHADGAHAYDVNDASKTLANTFATLTTGETLVLHDNQRVDLSLWVATNLKIAIDLNGYSVYHAEKDEFGVTRIEPLLGVNKANSALYIYSSKPGARLMNGYTQYTTSAGVTYDGQDRAGSLLRCMESTATLSVGYGLDGVTRGESIDLIGGQILFFSKGTVRFNKTEVYVVSGDNNTAIMLYDNGGDGRELFITDSNLYLRTLNSAFNFSKVTTNVVNITLKNTNIYSSNSSTRALWVDGKASDETYKMQTQQTIKLINSSIYNLKLNLGEKMRLYVEGECDLPEMINEYVTLAVGYYAQASTGTVAVEGRSYPQASLFGGLEQIQINGNYPYGAIVRSSKEYQASLYMNVLLDTGLGLNLYIPKEETLSSVTACGVECFDSANIQTIADREYYVIHIANPPKTAYKVWDIIITYSDGTTVTRVYSLRHSLLSYAKQLLSLNEEKYEGQTKEYLVDSQKMMKYILHYVTEVMTEYAPLDDETLAEEMAPFNALLGSFALTEEDLVLDDVKTDLPSNTGTAAAFDLDSVVGFALGVYNTFSGKVTVEIDGREVSGEFAGDYTEGDTVCVTGYVLLDGIFAYQLYASDITITIEGTNGTTEVNETFTYNLATYVNSGASGNVGSALYAYAKEAQTYKTKHPVGII